MTMTNDARPPAGPTCTRSDAARGRAALAGLLLAAAILPACAGGEQPPGPDAQRFDVTGVVVRVEGERIVLAHDEIEGLMEAMVMPFATRDEWALDVVGPGDRVQATLVVDGERSWLEGLVVTQAADGHDHAPSEPERLAPGTEVPDFTLVDQNGEATRLHEHRGEAVLLTFIYTRCPIPDFCPRMNQHFSTIERTLREEHPELAARTRLLSVSFDAVYDTPEVMARHARTIRPDGDLGRWDFIAATEGDAQEAATFFGLAYWEDTDQWVHNLRTVLIGPDSTVRRVYLGNDWTPATVIRDLDAIDWAADSPSS